MITGIQANIIAIELENIASQIARSYNHDINQRIKLLENLKDFSVYAIEKICPEFENKSAREKILHLLKLNLGKPVCIKQISTISGIEETTRRIRELRTELGYSVVTKMNGAPYLKNGQYMLINLHRLPKHDRKVCEALRREVLCRDNYTCQCCAWNHEKSHHQDQRVLEIHHIIRHADGGKTEKSNLKTLCHICHDETHKNEKQIAKKQSVKQFEGA